MLKPASGRGATPSDAPGAHQASEPEPEPEPEEREPATRRLPSKRPGRRTSAPPRASEAPPPAPKARSARPPAAEKRASRPAPKKPASKAPPAESRRASARPAKRPSKRPSKQPPSLEPLALSESFFPGDVDALDDSIANAKVPPLPLPPAGLAVEALPWGSGEAASASPSAPPFEDDGFEDELDAFFEAAYQPSAAPAAPLSDGPDIVTTTDDLDGIRQLFSEMAVPYLRPVRDFMLELRHADAYRAWIDACEPALIALRTASEQLGMPELGEALERTLERLRSVRAAGHERISGEVRADLLASFSQLTELLPEAFEVGGGREPVIVQLLLLQVAGVHKRTVEKLFRAGLHQFDTFLRSKPDEIAAVAGIEPELAARIVERFNEYASRVQSMLTPFEPQQEHDTLGRLVAQLREQDEAFERARAGWSKEAVADKRRLRRERGLTLKEIYVVLARLGEVARVELLERLPVRRQLEELEAHVTETGLRGRTRPPFA